MLLNKIEIYGDKGKEKTFLLGWKLKLQEKSKPITSL